jgi:hypothetical protein
MAHNGEADEKVMMHDKLGDNCDVAAVAMLGKHIEVVVEGLMEHIAAG